MLLEQIRAIFSSLRPVAGNATLEKSRDIDCQVLEDRVLLSALPLPVPLALDLMYADGPVHADWSGFESDANKSAPLLENSLDSANDPFVEYDVFAGNESAAPTERRQLIIIDASVKDSDSLIADLESQLETGERLLVEFLEADTDGIETISNLLDRYSDMDEVHIVSHGTDGAIKLGNSWLHTGNLSGYAGQIAGWADSLSEDADILIYGCDLAASDYGTKLVNELSELTGADVAASVDDTGSRDLGGDWDLEYTTGVVDTAIAFSGDVQQEWSGRLATLLVTNTADAGAGSLRDAINTSNASVGVHDTIEFMIGSGIQTISLNSGLSITDSVTIDGWTQPGWLDNPIIALDGTGAGIGADGLDISAGNTTIRGLVIGGFDGAGIFIQTNGNNIIEGNFIGIDVTGTATAGNNADGISIESDNNIIGGTAANTRNVISGNANNGIIVLNASGNVVQGNYIGTDATGTLPRGNARNGILLLSGAANNIIGGTAPGEENTIAHNGFSGVSVISDFDTETGNTIRGNSIFANTLIGIDLDDDGVTTNDGGDGDPGGNNLQNHPVITKAATDGGNIVISGTLNSTASESFELDFFSSAVPDASGFGQGETYLGSIRVNTNNNDHGAFRAFLPVAVPVGDFISATATDSLDNTSEFSASFQTHAASNSLWLSTIGAGGLGSPGLDEWTEGEVLDFGDPNLTLEPAAPVNTTNGTFSSVFAADIFAGTGLNVDAIHHVSRDITLGGDLFPAIDLFSGDVILSIGNAQTLNSTNSLAVDAADVFVYQPDTQGDYQSGTFTMLLDDMPDDIWAITLVEQSTLVGDFTLTEGDFLFTRKGGGADNDIWVFFTDDVGVGGNTRGTPTVLVEGTDIGINDKILGLDLIEQDIDLVGTSLSTGTILATIDADQTVGDNGLLVQRQDVFSLSVSQTTLTGGAGTGAAVASLLLEGLEVALDNDAQEDIDGLALVGASTNQSPVAVGDSYTVDEDTTLNSNDLWFDSNWSFRRTLSFDNLTQTENLTDFPVLVTLDASRIDYTETQDAGQDLRFVDGDGTVLAHEIEEWNESGTSYVWVRAPQIDANSNTDFIWMYYGNPTAPDGEDVTNVWSTDYKAVWHLDETSGTHFDSTFNNQDLNQAAGGVNKNASGKIDGADEFDGINEYLSRSGADTPLQITGDLTLEAWIWMDSYPGDSTFDMGTDAAIIEFAGFGDGDSRENYIYSLIVQNNGDVALGHESGAGTNHYQDMGVALSLNEWHQLIAVRDAAAMEWKLFLDGAPAGSTFAYSTNANDGSNGSIYIGWDHTYFDGIIDEVRVQDAVRSADWIAAQHTSTTDGFITYGYEQSAAGVLGNDVDPDGDPLTAIQIGPDPANAQSFTFNPDGTFTYTPNPDFFGVDTFQYRANDGGVDGNIVTVTINVNSVNDPPTAADDADTVNEGAAKNIDLAVNDNDTDDGLDVASINILSGPVNGSLLINADGTVDYTHDGSETVGDSFTYQILDNSGVASNTANVTITVTPVNDPPTVADDADTVSEGGTKNIDLAANDNDADDGLDLTSVNVLSGPTNGSLVINADGTVDYTHDGSETLVDSFTYEILDNSGVASNTANVTITVTPANDPPTAADDTDTVTEGGTKNIDLASNDNDVDDGLDLASINILSGPTNGSLVINADGTVDYTHDGSETVGDIFTYEILDNSGIASNTATVSITVTPLNDPPMATDDIDTVSEGGTRSIDLASNDNDVDDGLDLASINILSGPTNGSLVINADGTVDYTHDGSETVSDSFTYEILDNSGVASNAATVTITVTPLNDPPTAADDVDTVSEGSTKNIDLASNDNDVDDGLDLASINILSGPTNGSLVINADGTVDYTHDGSETVSDSFTYEILDNSGVASNAATVTITVTPLNDPPTAADDADTVSEGGTKSIDLAANDNDVDDGLDLASIDILSGPTNGSLVINADGTVDYTHDGSETVGDSFTYQILDNSGVASNTATVTITVTPLNDPPMAIDDIDTVSEGGTRNIDLASNDNDVDDGLDLASINILSGPTNGSLVINADGTVDYTHDGSETVSDSFTYEILDNSGVASNAAAVTITVTPLNDPPMAIDDVDTVSEGGTKNIDLASNDNDVDDGLDLTSVNVLSGPTNGSLVINADGTVDYTHDGSETLVDSFTYEILDNSGVTSNTANVTITVTPLNDPPMAIDDIDTVSEGGTRNIDLASNDNDVDDGLDLASINILSGPTNGSLVINADGTVDYTHDGSETVSDSFTYEILDNSGVASNAATVTITVTPLNDPPMAIDDVDTVSEGGTKNIDLASNDNDVDDGLDLTSVNVLSGPTNGSLVINADGTVDYTHDGSETLVDSFTYEILDNSGVTSNTANVTITVTPLNDPPMAIDDIDTVSEGGTRNIDLASNDNDVDDGLDLASINILSGPTNGSLVINADGTVDYTHDGSETVGDSFTYEILDNSGIASNTATVSITVTPLNDPPMATDDIDTVSEGGTRSIDLAGNDNDVDDGLDLASINILSGPTNGSLVINADGTVDYTHDGSETVSDSFTYEILDNSGIASNTATVSITVTPLNDPPMATDDIDTVSEGGTRSIDLASNDNDVDDGLDLASINILSGPTNGSLVINADGTVDYTHDGSETVSDSFTYEILDNSGVASNAATVTITVTPLNDPPTAADDADTVSEGGTKNIDLASNDNDVDDGLDLASINILSGPTNGSLVINADGTVDYTHDGSETVSDSFTYEILDNSGVASNAATVTITVTPLNDPPTAADDVDTVSEGSTKNIDLASNDNDVDDGLDLASINILSGPTNGSLVINADGTVDYTHDGSETVSDSFTYEILDNSGVASNAATVTITVTPLNDPPTAADDVDTVSEGSTNNIDLAGNDNDVDDGLDLASINILSGPTNGSLVINADGTVDYTHDGSETVSDSFTYEILDNSGVASNTATVTITVTPLNDPPTAADDADTVSEGSTKNIDLAGNDNDVDDGLDLASINILSGPTNGSLVINADGTVDYTHDGSETVSDSFTYEILDNSGVASNAAAVTITVTPLNDPPVIVSPATTSIIENAGFVLTVSAIDADGDPILYSIIGGDDAGLFSISPATGDLYFVPTPDFETPTDVGGDNDYVVDIEAKDGNGGTATQLITITVTPTNDNLPIFTTSAVVSVDENQTMVGVVNATDNDLPGQTVSYSLANGADASLFTINATTGQLEFLSPLDFEVPTDANGDNTLEVVVAADDGNGLVSTQLHQIRLLNVNESVTAAADTFTVDENTVLSGSSVLANDLDVDGDILSANLISGPSNGLIVWNTDGTFTYTPSADFAGMDSFTYTATDGIFSDVETVIINVLPIDDTPVVAEPTIAPAPVVDNDPAPTDDSDDSDEAPNLILVEFVDNSDDEEERDGVAIIKRDRTDRDATATVVANSRNITVEDSTINQRSLFYASQGNSRRHALVRAEAEFALLEPLQDAIESGSQTFSLYATPFASALDDLRDNLNVDFHFEMVAMGATIATTSSISVGYVFWMIRGGYLLGSLLSQVPAWKIIDPLQILDVLGSDEDEDDDESLESIIDDAGG